ncbi:hypothetical protein [Mitsuaria sp. 7]|uniref:AbiU2 domain-containing protein n=1 Tax=Mitsuaria sp. 7 TaxID=1658665 RepID=UPI0007DCECD4|nr:hypothetical protein [Mitsuaria sp. 7]ANH68246.1 hypothetical protein ABE85_12970 [Mitsuaria sp. 7]
MASDDLRETFLALREQCIWIRTCFNTFIGLFESGGVRHQLMDKTAPLFFQEINRILYENYILQVCKLTDKASTPVKGGKRLNLTVAHVNELLNAEGMMNQAIQDATVGLDRFRTLIEEARNRLVGHSDKVAVLSFVPLGTHTQQESLAFFGYMFNYVDAVGNAIGVGPLDFGTTSSSGDVHDLFKALNGGQYPHEDGG